MPIEVVHYNPRVRGRGFAKLVRRPLNNFGDLIGPLIVHRVAQHLQLDESAEYHRLVAVGSILKLTRPGDVVWGAGVNGKSMDAGAAPDLDVRAVRGPRTRKLLMDLGTAVPAVYGDPALLWSYFWPRAEYLARSDPRDHRSVVVVPNYNDLPRARGADVLSPIGRPADVIRSIALSDFVTGTSLHAIVLAESFGIPARLIRSSSEPSFKYDDYYAGTGRPTYAPAPSVEEALEMGGEPPAIFDPEALIRAFPRDLYTPRRTAKSLD